MVVRLPEMKKYLNRDGLEEYNSLLPHSSTEIEEYVADWLDAHPEATTTVQDGSITTQKLADASVTRNKLAADVAHLLGGMMLTKEVQGEILTADYAYSVAPLSMMIDGKSTQNGTPTPDSPVPIDSLEVIELPVTFAGKNLWGGEKLKADVLANTSGSTTGEDANGPYVQFILSGNTGKAICTGPFKDSTRYTFLLYVVRNGSTSANCNLQIRYTDGTSANLQRAVPESATVASYTNFVSAAGKTVQGVYILNHGGSTRLYYGQCGIFEGVYALADFVPYAGITANIPMQGHVIRSLPDGTCDTMSLSYLQESTRDGWAWYSRELMKKVGMVDMGTLEPREISSTSPVWYLPIIDSAKGLTNTDRCLCSGYLHVPSHSNSNDMAANAPDKSCELQNGQSRLFIKDSDLVGVSAADVTAVISDMTTIYPLATPIATQLDPVELPVLPAPNCTIWSDPTTGLKMSYMRDANIVISDIEQAIADQ